MKKNIVIGIAILILNYSQAFAWGYRGHKIIGQITKSLVDKNVADSVQYYLGEKSFEDASVWMDDMRSDRSFDYLKPTHYINIEKDKTYVKVSDPNIINELNTVFDQLQNRAGSSRETIKQNLMILFHLIEDLHQPLHAGYADDKGGNAVEVDFMGSKSNLHKVWDTNIIETQNISADDCFLIIKGFSEKEKKNISEINFVNWMNESRNLLSKVYSFKGNVIDQDYVSENTAIIRRQLAVSGIRLASVLNNIFSIKNKSGIGKPVKEHN